MVCGDDSYQTRPPDGSEMFQDGTELQFLLFCFFVVLASLSVQVWNAVTGNLLSSTDTRSQVMQTCSDPLIN